MPLHWHNLEGGRGREICRGRECPFTGITSHSRVWENGTQKWGLDMLFISRV